MIRHGFTETSSIAEVAAIQHAEWFMNAHRAKDTPWIDLQRPWAPVDPNADVTPERRAELEAELNARSAFPDA